ncbi:hypothetical protein [Thioclava sp. GXIMD4216]|uniref:hypothetical protein n=1 Tax=Thioclava sp. GXIMD4216 TaxID=3131929 RepID=UPI0030D4E8DD
MKKLLLLSTALIAVSAVPAHAGPVSWALLANGASLWSVAANAASALLATSFGRIAVSAASSLLSAALPARFDDRPQIRAVGRMEFEALVVGLTEAQLAESYADVRHACHGRIGEKAFLWATGSKFWN